MKAIRLLLLIITAGVAVVGTGIGASVAAAGDTNVGINKVVLSYDLASFGRRLTFRLSYFAGSGGENCANSDAANVAIVDTLPAGTTLVSESKGTGVYDSAAQTVTWNVGTLDRCATFGNDIDVTIAVAADVVNGAMLSNSARITTTTPQTTTSDDVSATSFQAGFLPLMIAIVPGKNTGCSASSALGGPDNKLSDGSPVGCSSSGHGTGNAFLAGVSLSGGELRQPESVVTIRVAGEGSGDGRGGEDGRGEGESDGRVDIRVTNPNAYDVPLRVVEDLFGAAAASYSFANFPGQAGMHFEPPPFPGRIPGEINSFKLLDADAGGIDATGSFFAHLDVCGQGTCGYSVQQFGTRFPASPGPDPELDPVEVQPGGLTRLDLAGGCTKSPVVPAGGSFLFPFGPVGGGFGGTAPIPDGFRSGYGVATGWGLLQLGTCAATMSQGPIRLEVTAHSPVDLMVTDPDGKRIGFDVASKRVIDEILGASFTGHGSEPETVRIPAPVAGAYDIGVEGIASGSFTIDVQTIDGASNVIDSAHFAGTATVGSEDVLPVHLSSDGGLGSGPPSPPADTTAPTIACDAANDAWHASDVSLHCTAADGGSGLANADDASFSLSTHVADGTETSDAKTDSRQVCDKAGNCATAGPIGGNKVDKKAPTIVIASPASDAAYTVGQSVAANYQCNDEGSGVASCAGPVANGAAIDTASVGAKSLAVAARDAAGNEANRLVAYSVGYGICTLYDQTQVKKLGSTVPIKLQLCNAAGLNLSSPAVVVHATGLVRVSDNVSGTVQDSGNANPDSDFRYDAGLGGSGGYIFNLSTKALTPGTWSVRIAVSGDPTAHEVQFQVR